MNVQLGRIQITTSLAILPWGLQVVLVAFLILADQPGAGLAGASWIVVRREPRVQ